MRESEFAVALAEVRPALMQIPRGRGYQQADCEDILSEATHLALLLLPEFKLPSVSRPLPLSPSHSHAPLFGWLTRIVKIVIMRRREREQRQPKTVQTYAACAQNGSGRGVSPLEHDLADLTYAQRDAIQGSAEGKSQSEIAMEQGVSRNTVARRQAEARELFRAKYRDERVELLTLSLLDLFSHHTAYHKQNSQHFYWMHLHPVEIPAAFFDLENPVDLNCKVRAWRLRCKPQVTRRALQIV